MSKRKSTIIDIAEKTGFSIATVSRALNNFSNVKPVTKEKILEVSRSMNYVPNVAAQSLVKGKSKLIGLILPDNSPIYNTIPYFMSKSVEMLGYRIVTYRSHNQPARQAFNIDQLLRQQVDGIVICPIPEKIDEVERILNAKIPFVVFNRMVTEYDVNNVVFNFKDGMHEAIKTLTDKGCTNIYQLVRQDIIRGRGKEDHFKEIMEKMKLPFLPEQQLAVDDDIQSGFLVMENLLKEKKKIDVIICSSDYTALGATRAIFDAGLNVPNDVKVVGCYNTPLASYANPRISSITADFRKMSEECATRVLDQIINPEEDTININVKTGFIQRDST